MLLQLRADRAVARDTPTTFYRGRSVHEIEADIEDIEYKRKLLLEKMTVVSRKIPGRSVNLTNPQFHFGTGDNIGKNKTETKESNKGFLYEHRHPTMLIIIGLVLVVFFGWKYESEISIFGFGKIVPPNNISKIFEPFNNPLPSGGNSIRPLEPLETGKKISELANGVYFFGSPNGIIYEIENPKLDFLEATSRRLNNYSFEIQKIDLRYYLVGFVSDEAYSKMGIVNSKNTMNIPVFPNQWGGAKNSIAIPFDAIYSIQGRTVDLDSNTEIRVLDVGFKEVRERPEIHSN